MEEDAWQEGSLMVGQLQKILISNPSALAYPELSPSGQQESALGWQLGQGSRGGQVGVRWKCPSFYRSSHCSTDGHLPVGE
jgi:hypothetical protein